MVVKLSRMERRALEDLVHRATAPHREGVRAKAALMAAGRQTAT